MIVCKNGGHVPIMFGTGASSFKDYEGLREVIKAAFENGIRGFDTAPSYKTEEILGRCIKQCMGETGVKRGELFIQTKIDAWQMMDNNRMIRQHLSDAAEKMQLDYFDAILVHWPVPEYFDRTWDVLSAWYKAGKVRHIGVCNVRMRQLEKLKEYEIQPQIIQIERNPLRTCDREIIFCHEHGISVQAYSPLCKMHDDIRTNYFLQEIADKYGKSVGQIVMRWHLETEVIPVFTSKKPQRIREYAFLSDFSLNSEEVKIINSMNTNYKMYLEAMSCPGF